MKFLRNILLLFALIFCLVGCSTTQPEEDNTIASTAETTEETTISTEAIIKTFEEGITLAWADLSGLTIEEALDAVTSGLPSYSLTLSVNDTPFTFTAEDLGMQLNTDALLAYLTALQSGEPLPDTAFATCQTSGVISAVKSKLHWNATNPAITYSKNAKQFVVTAGRNGQHISTDGIAQVVTDAIEKLADAASVRASYTYPKPTVTDSDARVSAALEKANSYLVEGLSYCYRAEGIDPIELPVTLAEQAAFISIGSDYSVSISTKAIRTYVDNVAKNHVQKMETDAFITSVGYSLPSYQVPYHKVSLDKEHLVSDLQSCLENGTSGVRYAQISADAAQKPYNGTYVEVSIDDQHLWYYKDGQLLVSCEVVTGKVSAGWGSRTGIYQVNNKLQDIDLIGYDYVMPVDYWIAYIGSSVGLHDALWRDEFGGDIFIDDGSHGCINMPHDAITTVYQNISIGTHVIIYGNTKSIVNQEFTGSSSYTVEAGGDPFKLDLNAKYPNAPLTYTSSDESVVIVNEDGTITAVGAGTATITVKSGAWWNVREGKFKVTINVLEPEPEPEPDTEPEEDPSIETEPEQDPTTETEPEQDSDPEADLEETT